MAEAKRIRDRFAADLHLIYVGERDEETAKKFSDALGQLQLPLDSTIHYRKGEPAEAILRALARENIDIIVAGALEKEVVLHPFLGNVARRLVREAPCSVMLFTTPAAKPKPLRRIVFVADYSEHGLQALKKALTSPRRNRASGFMLFVLSRHLTRPAHRFAANAGSRCKTERGTDEEEEALRKIRFVGRRNGRSDRGALHSRQYRVRCLGFCSISKSGFARGAVAEKRRCDSSGCQATSRGSPTSFRAISG